MIKKVLVIILISLICFITLAYVLYTKFFPKTGLESLLAGTPFPFIAQTGNNDISEALTAVKTNQRKYIKESSLGSATFTIDDTHSDTKEFLVDGSSVTLELMDQAGYKWTLMIPGDALRYPQTITMTALSDINSSTFPGKLTGGVRFEPDGLQFLKPAILTVSGKNLTDKSIIIKGSHDGTELDYAYLLEPKDSTISSYIFHFSTAYTSNMQKEFYEKAINDYNTAVEAAKRIMEQPLEIAPPPSFDYRCKDEEAMKDEEEKIKLYRDKFKNPEIEVISRLLAAKRNIAFYSEDYDDPSANPSEDKYVYKLYQRLLEKADKLEKTYRYQHEKCKYVTSVLMNVLYEGAMLNILDEESRVMYYERVRRWIDKTREYYFSEFNEKHDYKAFSAAWSLSKEAAMLGGDGNEQELIDAMSFELHFESESTSTNDSYYLHGEVPISFQPESFTLSGTGTGYYDKYVSYSKSETVKYIGPSTFKVNVSIDVFRPCEDSIEILVDKFGSDRESFIVTTKDGDTYTDIYDNKLNWEDPTAHTELEASFYDYSDGDTGYYRFPLQLNNMSANAVDETVSEDDGDGNIGKIRFRLVHKPK